MDGKALSLAFAAHSGPDCLIDVPKYGLRLKLYQAIKAELEAERCQVMPLVCPCIMLVYHVFVLTYYRLVITAWTAVA